MINSAMAFRDDMEALEARNEALEREVDRLQARLSQQEDVREALERATALARQQEQLVGQLVSSPVATGRARSRKVVWTLGMILLALIGGGVYLHVLDLEREIHVQSFRLSSARGQQRAAEHEVEQVRSALRQCQDQSRPLSSAALPAPAADEPVFDPVVRSGTVRGVTGEAPVAEGAGCTVRVIPGALSPQFNARTMVTCDGDVLYGRQSHLGYLLVGMRDGEPAFGRDDDVTGARGDPMLELDLAGDRVVVSDGASPGELDYTVEIALSAEE